MAVVLVDQQLKVDTGGHVVTVMFQVLGPRTAPDLNDHAVDGVVKAGHDEWLTVALLVLVGEVLVAEASLWVVCDVPDVLLISWVLV